MLQRGEVLLDCGTFLKEQLVHGSLTIRWVCVVLASVFWASEVRLKADDTLSFFLAGRYEECLTLTDQELNSSYDPVSRVRLFQLKVDCLDRLGKDSEAKQSLIEALEENRLSLSLRWRLLQKVLHSDLPSEKRDLINEMNRLLRLSTAGSAFSDLDLIAIAEFSLLQGADPKQVQTVFLKMATERFPESREVPLAAGRLALSKRDFDLASRIYRESLVKRPDDTELKFGLALACEEGQPGEYEKCLKEVLEFNPRHPDALLNLSWNLIDGEKYSEAGTVLSRIFEFNERHSDALATQATLALLANDFDQFELKRQEALDGTSHKATVDYLIGKILSKRYLFAEGAEAQRRSLIFDSEYLPAKKELAFNLLRLGQDLEGWQLANEVSQADEYDTSTYNLVQLEEELKNYTLLTPPGWRIRMHRDEAKIYGDQVTELLADARETLCKKYDVKLDDVITVEIFHRPNDFAVRTFGLPGAGGYLGVCFGDVVTAVSPEANPHLPMNWKSVLWHEFAHVVTLNKTHNRMPRWLSEGISVYEERVKNPRWRVDMTPGFRALILNNLLRPIDEISEAFLGKNSPGGTEFAYFQSFLFVSHLVENYGAESLNLILDDLAVGISFVDSLERHAGPLRMVQDEYFKSAKTQAELYGSGVTWDRFDFGEIVASNEPAALLAQWAIENPKNYASLKTAAGLVADLDKPNEAIEIYQLAIEAFAEESGSDSALSKLADLYRDVGDTNQEFETLKKLVAISESVPDALQRLIAISSERSDWTTAMSAAKQLLECRPMSRLAYSTISNAAEELEETEVARWSLSTELKFKEFDRSTLNFRLARNLKKLNEKSLARQHLLESLEETPRYRDALILLKSLSTTGQN